MIVDTEKLKDFIAIFDLSQKQGTKREDRIILEGVKYQYVDGHMEIKESS